jgi:hypothetical protein
MGDGPANILLWPTFLSQDLPCLLAVLIGKPFIIEIMNQTDDPPLLLVLASLPGNVTHHPFDGIGMFAQTVALIILVEKFQGLLACGSFLFHG